MQWEQQKHPTNIWAFPPSASCKKDGVSESSEFLGTDKIAYDLSNDIHGYVG